MTSMGGDSHCNCRIRKSNQILIKILLMVSCVVVGFLNAKIYVYVLYKIFLIFNLECHQRELFSLGQLQWLLPPMEVSKFQHPTKILCDALMMD